MVDTASLSIIEDGLTMVQTPKQGLVALVNTVAGIKYADAQTLQEKLSEMDAKLNSLGSPQEAVGSIKFWPKNLPEPEGWLFCNGGEFNINDYPELFAQIGYTYAKGANATTPNNKSSNIPHIRPMREELRVWEVTPTVEEYSNDTNIAIDPASGDIWVARNSGVSVLRGGTGSSWQSMGKCDGTGALAVHPITGDIWAAGSCGEISVLRGGVGSEWQGTDSGQGCWNSLAINPINGDVWAGAYFYSDEMGLYNGVQKTTHGTFPWEDTGLGIEKSPQPGTEEGFSRGLAVNSTTGDVWAGTKGGMKVLREGTGAWQDAGGYYVQDFAINPLTGDVWSIRGMGNNTVDVFRGETGSWSNGNEVADWNRIAFDPVNEDIWAASTEKGIKLLRGGSGKNWRDTGSPKDTSWGALAVHPITGDIWAASSEGIVSWCPNFVVAIMKAKR